MALITAAMTAIQGNPVARAYELARRAFSRRYRSSAAGSSRLRIRFDASCRYDAPTGSPSLLSALACPISIVYSGISVSSVVRSDLVAGVESAAVTARR
jgi:hypothetical protein